MMCVHINGHSVIHFTCQWSWYGMPDWCILYISRWPLGPPAFCLWPLNCYSFTNVFWLGQHMYTRTANDTQTAGSLTNASTIFNFYFRFRSSSRIHILPVVRDWKWRVPSKLLKQSGRWKSAILHSPPNQNMTDMPNTALVIRSCPNARCQFPPQHSSCTFTHMNSLTDGECLPANTLSLTVPKFISSLLKLNTI